MAQITETFKDFTAGVKAVAEVGRETRRGHRKTSYVDDLKTKEVHNLPLVIVNENQSFAKTHEVDMFARGRLPFNRNYIQTNTIETFITQYKNNVLSTLKIYDVKGTELELDKRLIKSLVRDVSIYGSFALVYDFTTETFKKLYPWQVKGNKVFYPFYAKKTIQEGYIIEERIFSNGSLTITQSIVDGGVPKEDIPSIEPYRYFPNVKNNGMYTTSIGQEPMLQVYELLKFIDVTYTEMKREMEKTSTKLAGTYETMDEDGNSNVNDDMYVKLAFQGASDSDRDMFSVVSPDFRVEKYIELIDKLEAKIVNILNLSSTTTVDVSNLTATASILIDTEFEATINYFNDMLFEVVSEYLEDYYDYTYKMKVEVEKGNYIKQNISIIADVIAKLKQSGAISYREMFNFKNKGADTTRILDETVRAKIEQGITLIGEEVEHATSRGYLNTAEQFENEDNLI